MRREGTRFATKHPLAHAMRPLFRAMVPLQGGRARARADPPCDPEENAKAVKSLAYYLDADMVGICEAPPYVWYSHDHDGTPLELQHKNAIVILVDQGHETMEAASGDDWMSGVQSMRAYLRGAEIAGHVAAQIRSLGHDARSHTNADSLVLQIPLILLAGLGELSRIGELVLNPFLGARFKSVVVTTDMPLAVDKPVDFGLQDMCSKCLKCARECPVSAISYGDKVMFNGYEMWKPDVERCTRYRVSNPNGSACGRCMKMCPFTNEGLLMHRALLWMAIHLPFTRRTLARLDDWIGHGKRNLVKKWWLDLEWVERTGRSDSGAAVAPGGVNARDLNLKAADSAKRHPPIAYHHANMMPPPITHEPYPVNRRKALEAAELLETPTEAKRRRERKGPPPIHYRPRPDDAT